MMTYQRASALVLADRRENAYDGEAITDAELLAAVRSDVTLAQVIAGADPADEVDEAYRVYLAHHVNPSREDLVQLLKVLLNEGILTLSDALLPEQRVWLQRVAAGHFDE